MWDGFKNKFELEHSFIIWVYSFQEPVFDTAYSFCKTLKLLKIMERICKTLNIILAIIVICKSNKTYAAICITTKGNQLISISNLFSKHNISLFPSVYFQLSKCIVVFRRRKKFDKNRINIGDISINM